ncbi:MAG: TIGR03619 family F420-dependent LLM class oxidoreductase [Alphaproteobacteria bacterium]|nr:TIGR03619 family F420-dependent LLM class oxidoreductase [Alphaproteobacteria bacterium]
MQFGVSAPFRGPLAKPDTLRRIAEKAEEWGYGYLTVSDHIVIPKTVEAKYPYSETGRFTWLDVGGSDCMEQFTLMAWLAAATNRIRLLSSVIVIPHRNPLFMAKSIATMDVLSGGRIAVGVGAGWMREEFEALGLPPFEARGQVTNEYIDAMKAAWTEAAPRYDGEFVKFDNIQTDPRPVQDPHPPIWIGGESMPALRRVVSHGDGWYPFGSNPKFRMDTVDAYSARRDKLFGLADAAGRDPATITLAYNCAFHNEAEQARQDGSRLSFTGSPEQRAEDIRTFADAGVSMMILNLTANAESEMLDRMEAFSRDVMPLVS